VARRCGVSAPAVSHWRRRYQERGLAGLHDELRPGRPRTHDDEKVAELIKLVVEHKPEHATHWSVRSAAATTGISKSAVGRYFALFGLQPHRSKSFKLSTDPFFVEQVRDLVGLYLNPPRQGAGAVGGREEPGASAGAHPTGVAAGLGLRRRGNP
jgi:putative transposase